MTRTRQTLTALFATVCFAAGTVAEESGQPPRRTRYPDASQTASSPPRYSFAGYGGFRLLQIDSRLFEINEIDFGITDDDFGSGRVGFELGFAVLPMVELLFGFDTGDAETYGSYLEYTYADGSEIEHSAWMQMTEYSLGARIRPVRGARLSPYLVLGVSVASYEYSEVGDFVDFESLEVIEGIPNYDIRYYTYSERLFLPGFFAGAGLDFAVLRLPFDRRLDVFGEFRYASAQGEHREGFDGLGDLTVGRMGGLFGLRFRF